MVLNGSTCSILANHLIKTAMTPSMAWRYPNSKIGLRSTSLELSLDKDFGNCEATRDNVGSMKID